jgi:putative Mn2+ efflux pump MntP
MKPGYWIGILALLGAVVGYAFYKWTGWYGAGSGAVLGILVGTLVYLRLKKKS